MRPRRDRSAAVASAREGGAAEGAGEGEGRSSSRDNAVLMKDLQEKGAGIFVTDNSTLPTFPTAALRDSQLTRLTAFTGSIGPGHPY